jgi:protein involved in polysaccharide export with SLBB domain
MPPDLQPQKMVVNLGDIWSLDPSRDLEIKEFDVIRVFSKLELERQPMVKVSGEVQNPGEYRLFKEMRIRDLLIEGGYPTPSAYLAEAEISRLKKTNDKVTSFPLSVNLVEVLKGDPKANFLLEPFDELTIRKIPNWAEETERYVTLSGEFRFPGVYPIYKGERLSSVIERAGGFSDKAYLPGAKFSRASLREMQQKRMDEALSKAEAEVAKKQADLASVASSKEEGDNTKTALEGLQRNINILKTKRAEGRLVIKLTALDKLKNTRGDVSVEGGDALFIPSDPDAVSILGQVYNPTSIVFEPHSNVGYYLDKVGGPTGDADGDEIYLVKMDGTVFSKKQSSGFFNSFMSRDVDSGDTIIVPQQFEKIAWLRDIKDIATILGQTALAAGVLIAAHVF